jgi:choline dehydrogenase-like flavoprotein
MQMGADPTTSVVDANGKMHQLDNVYVADGSVFATSSGSNPTLTIMAVALWIARGLTGQRH